MSNKQRRRPGWKSLSAIGIVALLCVTHAHAGRLGERAREKKEAEAERAALLEKLDALRRDIDKTESAKDDAAEALADAEKAISKASRALHDLVEEQRATEARLKQLSEEQEKLGTAIEGQRQTLAKLLRSQYIAGNEDRIKLLLSGDDPNRINRDLQYMGYVSQAQAGLIGSLRANLSAVETNRSSAQESKKELDEIVREQREQKARLEQEKAKRVALLAQLSSKLISQRKQAGNIARDEQRLGSLVDRLARIIDEQRKAEAAAREKRRQEQLARARERAKNESASRMRSLKTPDRNPDAIEDDEPPQKLLGRNELTPQVSVQDGDFGRPFGSLRGHLRLPVRGDLIAKFGSKRGDGPSWKGLFIRAPEGTDVKSVADGQVVFAEWLRGFGNLIIIDHGGEYMTIYGNNQSVLKRPGDIVKTGEVIASTGNSGGNEQSGLYFEMRYQGRAFDPLGWMTLR